MTKILAAPTHGADEIGAEAYVVQCLQLYDAFFATKVFCCELLDELEEDEDGFELELELELDDGLLLELDELELEDELLDELLLEELELDELLDELDSLEEELEEESLLEVLSLEELSLVEDGLSLDSSLEVDGSTDSVDVLVLVGVQFGSPPKVKDHD